MTSKRLRSGLYEVVVDGRTYHIEDRIDVSPDRPMWRLSDETGRGEWIDDYPTKREALAGITLQPQCCN